MNEDQYFAFKLATTGHNIFILAGPGTGKTFTLGKIVERQLTEQKKVFVTAATGIAANILKEKVRCPVTTLHRFLGIKDGRYTNSEILNLIINNDDYARYRDNILNVETVIIDEVSMISCKTFNQMEFLLRNVRQIGKPFGGVQIILSGDLCQLPPVPNMEYDDDGSFLIMSEFANFFHVCQLKVVVRQDEQDLIQAIHEVARGELSEVSEHLLRRLKRQLPPGPDPVKLFSLNFDVDLYNAQHLIEIEGEERVFHAEDEGDIRGCAGEKELHLKRGCPVMLVVNLSDELVNGLRGTVKDFGEDSVTVHFTSIQKTVCVKMFSFTKYSSFMKKDVGTRHQIPLKPCFAVTVHKSQGMTLDRVSIDCKKMFQFGQLTVGLSRACKKKGLQILNFSRQLVQKPPPAITDFKNKPFLPVVDNLSCCQNIECFKPSQSDVLPSSSIVHVPVILVEDEELNSDDEIQLIKSVEIFEKEVLTETEVKFPIPDNLNIKDLLNSIIFNDAETRNQKLENEVVQYLLENEQKTTAFVQYLWDQIYPIKEQVFSSKEKIENKTLTDFYKDFNKIITGENYKMNVRYLFQTNPSIEQFNVVFKLTSKVRKCMLDLESDPIKQAAREKAQREKGKEFIESGGGRGKIRYIAGWCLHSLKKKMKTKIQKNMYDRKKVKMVERLVLGKNLIEHLEAHEVELVESSDSESVKEIERKQNIRKGLTNISDSCFKFFLHLDKKIRNLQTNANLNLYGSKFSIFLSAELENDNELSRIWTELFANFGEKKESFHEAVQGLLHDVYSKYILMSVAQLRKEYLEEKKAKKSEATRKQIKMRTDSKKAGIFNFMSIKNDISLNKEVSHRRLQSEVLKEITFLETTFKKTELHLLSDAYGVKSHRCLSTKKIISEKLKQAILDQNSMPHSEIISKDHTESETFSTKQSEISLPGTSHSQPITDDSQTGKESPTCITTKDVKKQKRTASGKGKGKKKKRLVKWPCGVCKNDASFNSVGCDRCDTWYHGDCLKIDLDSLGDEWFCQSCQEEMEKESE